jgi:hypothetical protein
LDGADLVALCIDAQGNGLAIGEGIVASSADDANTWVPALAVPTLGPFGFAASEFSALGCADGVFSGGGYTAVGFSVNAGASWDAGAAVEGTFPAQLNTLAQGPSGAWVAGGYYGYLGRSIDGVTFAEVDPATPGLQWYNGVAAQPGGAWWAVGEGGAIAASTNDGQTWAHQVDPNGEDLYAVAFADPLHGLAVGAHGAAVYTADAGGQWVDVSTGLDVFLGDVTWLNPQEALVVGEAGTVLHFAPP